MEWRKKRRRGRNRRGEMRKMGRRGEEAKVAAGRNLRNRDFEDRQLWVQIPWLPISGCVMGV